MSVSLKSARQQSRPSGWAERLKDIEEGTPSMTDLKIEAGKCYETRDGHRAYVVYADPLNDTLQGLVQHERGPVLCSWYAEGCLAPPQGSRQPHDLISEWKEPRKGEVWVNVYGDGDTSNFSCQEAAIASWNSWKWRGRELLAMLGPIRWTEGQGLDGEGSGDG